MDAGYLTRLALVRTRLSYDNARIPEVLLRVGHRLGDQQLVDAGKTMLDWYEALCMRDGHYRFPGHRGLENTQPADVVG